MTVGTVGNRIIRRCVGQKKPDYFSNLQIKTANVAYGLCVSSFLCVIPKMIYAHCVLWVLL